MTKLVDEIRRQSFSLRQLPPFVVDGRVLQRQRYRSTVSMRVAR